MMNMTVDSDWLISLAFRGTAFLLPLFFAGIALKSLSAARRHGIWLAGEAGLLVLPVLILWGPAWKVLPDWRSENPAAVTERNPETITRVAREPESASSSRRDVKETSVAPASEVNPARNLIDVVGAFWLLGLLAGLSGLIREATRLKRLESTCVRRPDMPLLREVAKALGLRRCPILLEGPVDFAPMVWGVWSQRVLLPKGFDEWGDSKIRAVLLHELAHLERGDPLSLWIGHVARAFHWFNPLAWLALSRMRVDQERACDDTALRHGLRASDYAQVLLEVSLSRQSGAKEFLCAPAMARLGSAERRVQEVLDAGRSRTRAGVVWQLFWAGLAAALAIPLATLVGAEPNFPPPILVANSTEPWKSTTIDGRDYLSLGEIAERHGSAALKLEDGRAELANGKTSAVFTRGSRELNFGGTIHRLNWPVVEENGTLWMAEDDFTNLLQPLWESTRTGPLEFETVVIDPGHGGSDVGAKGNFGDEKTFCLQFALILKDELEKRGLRVLLTRDSDRYMNLAQRVKLANDTPQSILLSLHFNSGTSASKGFETFVPVPTAAASQSSQSLALATALHRAALMETGLNDRGISRANWKVLAWCKRPAVLMEAGFVTHPEEGRLISTPDYQRVLAVSVAEAVKELAGP